MNPHPILQAVLSAMGHGLKVTFIGLLAFLERILDFLSNVGDFLALPDVPTNKKEWKVLMESSFGNFGSRILCFFDCGSHHILQISFMTKF